MLAGDSEAFRDEASLVFSGRLDSSAIVELVVYLEQEFGIDFSDTPFDQAMFDSVVRICSFIEQR